MAKKDRDAVSQGMSQILGGSDAADLLGNVIQSDRQRAGRTAASPAGDEKLEVPRKEEPPEVQEIMTSHNVIGQYDNKAIGHSDNKASIHSDNRTSGQTDKQESGQADKQVSPIAIGQADTEHERSASGTPKREGKRKQDRTTGDLLEARLAEARRMAESSTTTVTLRLPRELNDWLDEYVHRAWPERVRKQELVIEGLRLLFARRGRPGEPIVETSLLPE
jgi:hypothetical protein